MEESKKKMGTAKAFVILGGSIVVFFSITPPLVGAYYRYAVEAFNFFN